MRITTVLLALVGSANAATLSPGTSYNLDYTETTTPDTTLSGHIDTIKTHVGNGDFGDAYTHYETNVKSLVTGVTSAIDTLFDTHNSDAGNNFPAQADKYLIDVRVRQTKKPLSLLTSLSSSVASRVPFAIPILSFTVHHRRRKPRRRGQEGDFREDRHGHGDDVPRSNLP